MDGRSKRLGPGEERASRGLLSAFRRKKEPAPVAGCDPDLFADEIRVFLERAADKKRQLQNTNFTAPDMRPSAVATTRAAAAQPDEPAAAPSSSWSSPFEWKPSGSSARSTRAPEDAPAPAAPVARATELPFSVLAEAAVAPPEPPAAVSAAAEPVLVSTAPESVVAEPPVTAAAPAIEPVAPVVVEAVHGAPPAAEPIVHAVAHPVTVPEPIAAAKPAAPKAPAPEPARLKPVADRGAKIAARGQLQDLGKRQTGKGHEDSDRLGPLARWARSETPRATRTTPVTADDVRALISSLAVPSAVASVTYPRGCRIRRVRVPVSRDHDGAEGNGPVILSRRSLAEQRDKHPSA